MTDGRGPTDTEPDGRKPVDDEKTRLEQKAELRAFIGLLGTASGLTHLPAFDPDADRPRLPKVPDAVDALSAAKHVPPEARLELLSQLRRSGRPNTEHEDLLDLAGSLVPDPSTRTSTAAALLKLLDGTPRVVGRDALGRAVVGPDVPNEARDSVLANTTLQDRVVTSQPICGEKITYMGEVPALNIVTDRVTPMPLAEFHDIVNPLQWPTCWLEQAFFSSMTVVAPPAGPDALQPPDQGLGFQARVLEIVDFGLGIGPPQLAKTELDFVMFFDPASGRVGSTYDFYRSQDQKITVDQGYLLVEDLGNRRRYRTQKLVHMTASSPLDENVCWFWSMVVGLVQEGCAGLPPAAPPPGQPTGPPPGPPP